MTNVNYEQVRKFFGPVAVYEIANWRKRGYDVTQSGQVLTISKESIKVQMQRVGLVCEVHLLEPTEHRRVANYRLSLPDAPLKIISCANDYLSIAKRDLKRKQHPSPAWRDISARKAISPTQLATYSREWRELFAELEQAGYYIGYGQIGRGVIYLEGHGGKASLFLRMGTWYIAVQGSAGGGLFRSDTDDEAQSLLRKWITKVDEFGGARRCSAGF